MKFVIKNITKLTISLCLENKYLFVPLSFNYYYFVLIIILLRSYLNRLLILFFFKPNLFKTKLIAVEKKAINTNSDNITVHSVRVFIS